MPSDDELEKLWEKGKKAWANVPSATEWVEELRGHREEAVQFRLKNKVVGESVWTDEQHAYQLPEGLPNNVKVTLVSQQGQDCVVRDAEGKDWTLRHWQVTAGHEYRSPKNGRWYYESHPAVRAMLKARIADLCEQIDLDPRATIATTLEETIKNIQKSLDRHSD